MFVSRLSFNYFVKSYNSTMFQREHGEVILNVLVMRTVGELKTPEHQAHNSRSAREIADLFASVSCFFIRRMKTDRIA